MSNERPSPVALENERTVRDDFNGLSRRTHTIVLVFGVVLVVSTWIAEFNPLTLTEPAVVNQMWKFAVGVFPPDVSYDYLIGRSLRDGLLWATVETLAISILGTVLAFLIGFPLALLSAANVTYRGPMHAMGSGSRSHLIGRSVNVSARSVLSFLRSVPDLVWGFLFVTAVGLGPFAGVLALGVHNAGVLGKLYADFLEDTDPAKIEAIRSTGATRFQTIVHGILPQITPTVVSYTLYRWECSIRAATILGFVGAGGIGYYLVITIKRLQYHQLATAILAVFLLVLMGDRLSEKIRAALV